MSSFEDRPPSFDGGEDPSSAQSDSPQPAFAQLAASGLGSGLLAKQPTPEPDEKVSVARVCPQCGGEYDTTDRFCPKDGTPLRPKAGGDPLIGRVIADRYLILALVGEGGMGRVYLAEHVKMNRQCAIKVMNPSLIHDDDSHQRFAREASSAASILHPNVAAVFDYGEADKIVYLVMEYVDGESISTIVAREGALDPRRAIDIARQVADGLHAAHELGIVHRDLKPDNIIVTRNRSGKEIPKVVDFGIAKAVTDSREDGLTQSGLVIGTPEYMSPEQLLGDPVDARADIYSLGCILYQMLTGQPAFAAESREQMIRRRLHEAPPHIRDVIPELPRRLDTTIVHMLARSPKDRMPSAAEARDALDPALALGGWDPANITVASPATTGSRRTADPSLQPTMPMPRARTSAKGVAIGTTVVALALVAGVAMYELSGSSGQAATPAPVNTGAPTVATTPTADSLATRPPVVDTTTPAVKPNANDTGKKRPAPVTKARTPSLPQTIPGPIVTAVPKGEEDPFAPFAPSVTRLKRAIEAKDWTLIMNAFPDISPDQRRGFEDLFNRAKTSALRIDIGHGKVERADSHASGTITLNIEYNDPTTLQKNATPYRYDATWDLRADDAWHLVSLKTRSAPAS
jgi:serine/threonine-protein kinase